jgi:hypothetical protein
MTPAPRQLAFASWRRFSGSASQPNRLLIGLKIFLAVAIIYYIASKIDISVFAATLQKIRPDYLALTLLQLLVVPVLGAVRWGLVQTAIGHPLPRGFLLRAFWVGMLFSQVLPSASGGDAIRGWLAWRAGVPARSMIHGILLERIAVVLSLLLFVAVLGSQFVEAISRFGPLLLIVAALGGLAVLLWADYFPWLPRLRLRLVDPLLDLSRDSRRTFLSTTGIYLTFACFATHINLVIVAWWLAAAMELPIDLIELMALIPVVTLLSTLPVSIGGWGVREGLMVILFEKLGISNADALAFSILFGLAMLFISLPGLPIWLMLRPTAEDQRRMP